MIGFTSIPKNKQYFMETFVENILKGVRQWVNTKLNKKQDILNAGKNITINKNTISAKEYTKGQNIDITDEGVVSAKGYVFNESNTSFSQGIGTITRNTAEHAEGKYNKSNIVPVFVDLGLSVKWASANVGATCGDTVESWYGGFYAWSETETKSEYNWNTYKYGSDWNQLIKYCPTNKTDYWSGEGSPDGKTILDAVDDIAAVEFGANYRMPTKAEIEELIALPNQWVTDYNGISGLNGRVFTGTNGNTLFIPAADYFDGSTHYNGGSDCYLWSSSLDSGNPCNAWYLYFNSDGVKLDHFNRYYGFSVRCVSRINTHTHNDHPLYTQQSIGVGTSEQHRQNAVEVMDDGSVYIKGIDLFDGTNPHESYSLQKVIQTLLEDRLVTSAQINKLTNQVDDLLHTLYAPKMKFIDLGISVKWAQYNAGVNPENLSTAESWYGGFYAWGETETKTDYSWATYKYANGDPNKLTKYCPIDKPEYWGSEGDPDNKTVLDDVDDLYKNTLYKYFKNQYRMPTKEEIQELLNLPNKWVTDFKGISGLNGRMFAKTQTELDGTFNDDTMLFIPAAGFFNESTHSYAGSNCCLWSSSLDSGNPSYAWDLDFYSDGIHLYSGGDRYCGLSVRCVSKDI